MRIRFVLFGGTATLFAGALAVEACGGDTGGDPVGTPDSGGAADVVADVQKDTGRAPEPDANPPCDPNADFLKEIPDASLADGATSTGICMGCISAKCDDQVEACKKDCPCQDLAGDALDCYAKNSKNPLICAAGFGSVNAKTRDIGLALFGCVQQSCKSECAAEGFVDGGRDSGDGG